MTDNNLIMEWSGLHESVLRFLRRNGRASIESFALGPSHPHDTEFYRHTYDRGPDPGRRSTVSFFCLEALAEVTLALNDSDVLSSRQEWLERAKRAVSLRFGDPPGPVIGSLVSSRLVSGMLPGPNVVTAFHCAAVVTQAIRMTNPPLVDGNPFPRKYARTVLTNIASWMWKQAHSRLVLHPDDEEHPYILFRVLDALDSMAPGGPRAKLPMCRNRVAGYFNKLSSLVAHKEATSAECVDLALLWAAAGISDLVPVSDLMLRATLPTTLRIVDELGDWPIGHALTQHGENSPLVPSCEVSSALLRAVLSGRWSHLERDLATLLVGRLAPIARRVMKTMHKGKKLPSGVEPIGWCDTRIMPSAEIVQSFTTASHVIFLSRLLRLLRELIRHEVVLELRGKQSRRIGGPGFEAIEEVDSEAPVGEFLWDNVVRHVDPCAPELDLIRRRWARGWTVRQDMRDCENRLQVPDPKQKDVSLILYGPPGTGKTTYARAIAKWLRWPLVTITPGDFTQHGEPGIEKAAQEIFGLLLRTERVVVLLDECDELLRSREDVSGGSRTLLSFLTASMLPKLADLHDRGRLVFVVATNYAERMDLAAIRGGRFDHRIAVPPPDEKSREEIVKRAVGKTTTDATTGEERRPGRAAPTSSRDKTIWKAAREIAKATDGLTRDELLTLVQRLQRKDDIPRLTPGKRAEAYADAQNIRLNDLDRLALFYAHMDRNSAPVQLKRQTWNAPSYAAERYRELLMERNRRRVLREDGR